MSGQRNVEERVTELSDSWQQQQESAETCERARRLGAGWRGLAPDRRWREDREAVRSPRRSHLAPRGPGKRHFHPLT